ncbi:DgyrCDS5192 [Dimorphilus gyrociliatus]|uniref:DgyrCDS5192 n=1 Tax=Dimorphilus gyrociliatus TaxID=2664684 RepID=A0A7I8VJ40_9ANNE|nr:DgyrCDS5192 [Dimorphilus gyrociliatus]
MLSNAATQQKFSSLRKRLDQLGYRQPLGIESLPLVERLFADLLHTTDSLKQERQSKSNSFKDSNTSGEVSEILQPYKSDNAKLVRETNELHKELITVKDQSDKAIKELKAKFRKSEADRKDLLLLNNQYVIKVGNLERESKQKSDKILSLQEKNMHAVVQTPGGRKKNIPFRRQRMEIDCLVPEAPVKASETSQKTIDLLELADRQISSLTSQVKTVQDEKQGLKDKIDLYRNQIEEREKEIDRLYNQLQGGRPYDVVALEARNRSHERHIAHLNIQLDYLQQKNDELLNQGQNGTQQRELLDNEVPTRDSCTLVSELDRTKKEFEILNIEIEHLKAEKDALLAEMNESTTKCNVEIIRMTDLLEKVQEDKKNLSSKITKLTKSEKDLIMEIERLKKQRIIPKNDRNSNKNYEKIIKSTEEERDYWKAEVETLQDIMKNVSYAPIDTSHSLSNKNTEEEMKQIEDERNFYKSEYELLRSTKANSPSPVRTNTSSTTQVRLDSVNDDKIKTDCSLSDSIEVANNNCQMLINESFLDLPAKLVDFKILENYGNSNKEALLSSQLGRIVPEVENLERVLALKIRIKRSQLKQYIEQEKELEKVKEERDKLQKVLNTFEEHMAEIQSNVKVLTTERNKFLELYNQTKAEIDTMKDNSTSARSPKATLATQAVFKRVELERDESLEELRKITAECESLKERLQIATETQIAEKARLEQKINDLQSSLSIAELKANEAVSASSGVQSLIDSLENKLREEGESLNSHKTRATQMRLLAENAERAANDAERQLTRIEEELKSERERSKQLERESTALHTQLNSEREKYQELRNTVAALDRDKDTIQSDADHKTELILSLKEEVMIKDRALGDIQLTISELEGQLSRTREDFMSKDHEIRSLKKQLDDALVELSEVERGRDITIKENRALHSDLATMTKEHQYIQNQLDQFQVDKEHLKDEIKNNMTQLKKAEELLMVKERQRSDLLEQYKALSANAEGNETAKHELESYNSSLRLEIMTRDAELRRLKERCDVQDHQLQELTHVEASYEAQVSHLSKSVGHLEECVRQAENDKRAMSSDLAAVRELCAKLELSKDQLQRQLAGLESQRDVFGHNIDDVQRENDALREQIRCEHESVTRLESLLSTNREKEYQTQLFHHEAEAEILMLKDRLALCESKYESQNKEVVSLRSKNIELEGEIDKLKRQVTNEKFERERAAQELRRHGIVAPGDKSRSPGSKTPVSQNFPDNKENVQHSV